MFSDGLDLLKAIDASGHRFAHVGIPSYPEGHPAIDDETLWQTLTSKQQFATYTVTQMCFDADAISRFVVDARTRGIGLPIVAGIPGAVSASKLLRVGTRIGVGDSIRFARGNRSIARRLFGSAYRPDALVRKLAAHAVDGFADHDDHNAQVKPHGPRRPRPGTTPVLAGLHIYTFNEIAATLHSLENLGWSQGHGAAVAHEGGGHP